MDKELWLLLELIGYNKIWKKYFGSSYEMDFTEETITERFTRGDASRTTEGHGLGLAIVKSFAEACGGTFHIHIDGDMFKAIVVFKRTFPEKNEVALVPEKIYDK